MPKVIGTRERVHPAYYESLYRGHALVQTDRQLARQRTARRAEECHNCGAPRSDAAACDYCGRKHA